MSFESKLPLFFLFLSFLSTSTLAIEFSNHHQDARHELMQCMEHCQTRLDGGEQRECIQECHLGYKERQQEEKARLGGYDEELLGAMINPNDDDSKVDLEKCELDCLSKAKRGVDQELECVKKCVDEHKKERGRHYSSADKDDESELRECQRYCVGGAMHTYTEVYECEKKCFEDYSEERERRSRERQRGGHSVDKDDHSDSDEKHKLEKCQLDCMTGAKRGVIKVYECEKKCVEEYQEEKRRQRGKQSVEKKDDKHELKECLIDCGMGAKHTVEEVLECNVKCMKEHQEKLDNVVVVNQQVRKKEPECQRQCWRKSPGGSSVEYECTTVCRRDEGTKYAVNVVEKSKNTDHQQQQQQQQQQRLSECLKWCQRQGQGHECQQICQKEFQRRHPILGSIMELTAGLF